MVYCLQGNGIDRSDTAGCNGKGWSDKGVCYTLNTIDRPAVVYDTKENQGSKAVVCAMQGFGDYVESDVVSARKARDYKDATDLVVSIDCRNLNENEELSGTLQAKKSGGYSLNYINPIRRKYMVRRLTPLECERLQGFPDGWTDIGEWTNSKEKTQSSSDAARYKALGNSIALPPWRYVLQKLSDVCGEDKSMGSLFDGIGGFPLIWTEINGIENCKWASEIEEFPIAVTTKHFNKEK